MGKVSIQLETFFHQPFTISAFLGPKISLECLRVMTQKVLWLKSFKGFLFFFHIEFCNGTIINVNFPLRTLQARIQTNVFKNTHNKTQQTKIS